MELKILTGYELAATVVNDLSILLVPRSSSCIMYVIGENWILRRGYEIALKF